jgi:hypothetical protein
MTQRDLDALDQPFAPEPFERPAVWKDALFIITAMLVLWGAVAVTPY